MFVHATWEARRRYSTRTTATKSNTNKRAREHTHTQAQEAQEQQSERAHTQAHAQAHTRTHTSAPTTREPNNHQEMRDTGAVKPDHSTRLAIPKRIFQSYAESQGTRVG